MLQTEQPHVYGADDQPKCPDCSGRMRLIRRMPHPQFGTFDYDAEGSADAGGQPHV
jgi:hypothetical protein